MTGRALGVVAGALDLTGLPASVIRSARFLDSRRAQEAVVTLDACGIAPSTALVVASRAQFDAQLLDAACSAGASLVRARVGDVQVDERGVRLETSAGAVQADRIVGADGVNSLVRRRVAAPFRREQLSIATGFFAHGITCDEVAIELMADPPGYLWSFPRPTHLAIGVCAQANASVGSEELRHVARKWIADTGIARGGRLERYAWPIPSLSATDFGRLALAGPRWCLVGDAAGLVDPITREGIFFALRSGHLAADAMTTNDPEAGYAVRVNDEIGGELRRAARLKAGFFRPRFTRLLMDGLLMSHTVRAIMADLVAGRQGYAGLTWRLARTLEVGLAWRLLMIELSTIGHHVLRE